MRVGVLVWTHAWGGLETHAVDLMESLDRVGHDAVLACVGPRGADLFRTRVAAERLVLLDEPANGFRLGHWVRQLRRLRATACVFEKGTLHTGGLSLDLAARLVFKSFITVEHLQPPVLGRRTTGRYLGVPGPGLWWYSQRLRGALRGIAPAAVVCVADAVRQPLVNDYLFPRHKTVVVHNGVDVERFSSARRAQARQHLQVDGSTLVIGIVGRLIPLKGIDVALRAFRTVLDSVDVNAQLVVIGDGPERASLSELTGRLSLERRVRFLGFLAEPSELMPAIDVLLVPSYVEAQGRIVLEGLASGCDVLASDVGGIPEMLLASDVYTLVPAGDVAAWAQALGRALSRPPEERAQRSVSARQHVVEHFDSSRHCEHLARLLTADHLHVY